MNNTRYWVSVTHAVLIQAKIPFESKHLLCTTVESYDGKVKVAVHKAHTRRKGLEVKIDPPVHLILTERFVTVRQYVEDETLPLLTKKE